MNQTDSSLRAPIAYLAGVEKNPETLVFPKSSGRDTIRPEQKDHVVLLRDIRAEEKTLSLEDYGFQLIKHRTSVVDLFDNDLIKGHYYPEMSDFLKLCETEANKW